MFCLCSVVWAALAQRTLWLMHTSLPQPTCSAGAAPWAGPAPLTAFPSSVGGCLPGSWASRWPDHRLLHPGTRTGCVHYSSVTITHRVRCRTQFQQEDLWCRSQEVIAGGPAPCSSPLLSRALQPLLGPASCKAEGGRFGIVISIHLPKWYYI